MIIVNYVVINDYLIIIDFLVAKDIIFSSEFIDINNDELLKTIWQHLKEIKKANTRILFNL
jgi:hypothetical protein